MSAVTGDKLIVTANSENLAVAVGISFLTVLQEYLELLPIFAAAVLIFEQSTLFLY